MLQLSVTDLSASINNQPILQNISLQIKPGTVHALMGPNGSGKSTLASVLMGHPQYQVTSGIITMNNHQLTELDPEKRAQLGLFLAFQHPIAIPGVSIANFLRHAYRQQHPQEVQIPALAFFNHLKSIAEQLNLSEELLKRSLNDGLSGGERKKMETLQMLVLKPKYIILDEIDTGTDVDALKILGQTINSLVSSPGKHQPGILLITHYSRILQYIKPHYVHVLKNGQIVKTGSAELVIQIEKNGYQQFK